MVRSIINGPDIGDTMRDIQRREGRDGTSKPLDDADTDYEIKLVPITRADRRTIGLVKLIVDGRVYIRPGAICTHCTGDKTCNCFGVGRPTHWGRLPDDWNIK